MSNQNRFADWARRSQGRGQSPQIQSRPVAPAPAKLAPPPAGFGYMPHPDFGMILVPLSSLPTTFAAPATLPTPPRQPQGTIYYPGHQPQYAGPPGRTTTFAAPARTCMIVKEGDVDCYSHFLQGIPDLLPNTGNYDAMAGNPDPATVSELAGKPEFAAAMLPDAVQSRPDHGRGAAYDGMTKSPELGTLPLPPVDPRENLPSKDNSN